MLIAMGSKLTMTANFAAYSFDGGATFTNCVIASTAGQWFGAAYSPSLGYAIMIGSNGTVLQSFDGITWNTFAGSNLPNSNWQGGVVRNSSDTLFVASALGASGSNTATSPDGQTWTVRSPPAGAFGSVIRACDNDRLVACGSGGIIRSLDGGVTWGAITSAGDTNSDIAWREGTDYLHVAGNTSSNAGDTYFSNNFGGAWTKCLRDALNDPPNCFAIAIDPTRGHVYQMATSLGIWRINAGEPNNPVNNNWTQVYAAGSGANGCRGGYIAELDKIIFTSTAGNFSTHQNDLSGGGGWQTVVHGNLSGAARIRLQFLGFPPP